MGSDRETNDRKARLRRALIYELRVVRARGILVARVPQRTLELMGVTKGSLEVDFSGVAYLLDWPEGGGDVVLALW